jgi:hypothetical protein
MGRSLPCRWLSTRHRKIVHIPDSRRRRRGGSYILPAQRYEGQSDPCSHCLRAPLRNGGLGWLRLRPTSRATEPDPDPDPDAPGRVDASSKLDSFACIWRRQTLGLSAVSVGGAADGAGAGGQQVNTHCFAAEAEVDTACHRRALAVRAGRRARRGPSALRALRRKRQGDRLPGLGATWLRRGSENRRCVPRCGKPRKCMPRIIVANHGNCALPLNQSDLAPSLACGRGFASEGRTALSDLLSCQTRVIKCLRNSSSPARTLRRAVSGVAPGWPLLCPVWSHSARRLDAQR